MSSGFDPFSIGQMYAEALRGCESKRVSILRHCRIEKSLGSSTVFSLRLEERSGILTREGTRTDLSMFSDYNPKIDGFQLGCFISIGAYRCGNLHEHANMQKDAVAVEQR